MNKIEVLNDVKKVGLHFSNVNAIWIPKEYVISISIDGVKGHVLIDGANTEKANSLYISIDKKWAEENCFDSYGDKLNILETLKKWDNLCSVILLDSDNNEREIWLPWGEAEEWTNEFQIVKIEDDKIIIEIIENIEECYMGLAYKDMINRFACDSYDLIQDLIGFYCLHSDGIEKSLFAKEIFKKLIMIYRVSSKYHDSFISGMISRENAEKYFRKVSLEEFRRYTVELYKVAIYDECSIIESIEEFDCFYRRSNMKLDLTAIRSINKDKLYQFISDFFDWMYAQDYSRNKIKLVKKINELEIKYCEDIKVMAEEVYDEDYDEDYE